MNTEIKSYQVGQLYPLDIAEIHENPDQPRKNIDREELDNLKTSISAKGVLQPVLVIYDKYRVRLVDGHRRFLASKELGLNTIPAVFIDGDETEIALISNLQRDDLHPIDQAEALLEIKDQHDYTQEELVRIIGKKQNTISEILRLNDIPDDIREECRTDKRWSRNMLLQIAKKRGDKSKRKEYQRQKELLTKKRKERAKSTEPELVIKKCRQFRIGLRSLDNLDDKAIHTMGAETRSQMVEELDEAIKQIVQFQDRLKDCE